MPNVIISAAMANKQGNGGNAWVVLNWVLGFRALGFGVHFIEQIARQDCINAEGAGVPFEQNANRAYFREVAEEFGLSDVATLIYEDGAQTEGRAFRDLLAIAEDADLLINISGHLTLPPLFRRIRRKAYIDLDPGFTQFWHASGLTGARLAGHDVYFTIGENIGTSECTIPTSGIDWRPTRQPIVLAEWPVADGGDPNRFTTVASWRGAYGPVCYEGRTYGVKVHEFRKFVALPERAEQSFEIALDIYPGDTKDRDALVAHGWHIVRPQAVADPGAFRRYVQTSGAEFSPAQGVYVGTRSGWFSDRTVRYLASGKPALVQDTGFRRTIPAGDGVIAFRTLDEAAAGAAKIARDYENQCIVAREITETYFDATKVLGRLVEEAGVLP
jgi:hypothetical protein